MAQVCQSWLCYFQDPLLKVHQLKFTELQLNTNLQLKYFQISKFGAKRPILIFGRLRLDIVEPLCGAKLNKFYHILWYMDGIRTRFIVSYESWIVFLLFHIWLFGVHFLSATTPASLFLYSIFFFISLLIYSRIFICGCCSGLPRPAS